MAPAFQLVHDCLGFCPVDALSAAFKDTVHMNQVHTRFPIIDRGEGVELVFIEPTVAESDQALVLAPVMPEQMCLRHVQSKAVIQNAFHILFFQMILICCAGCKEGGRRHLLGISDDDRVFTAGQCAYGFAGGKLGCFIKHNQVERLAVGVQILRHRDRAHQHTRAKLREKVGDLLKELPNACPTASAANGPLQDSGFRASD